MDYIIFVRNEQESKKVQEILLKNGYRWETGDGVKTDRFYFIYAADGRALTFIDDDFRYVVNSISNSKNTFRAVNGLDIAEYFPPEKMLTIDGKAFSESTIKAALRQYVG